MARELSPTLTEQQKWAIVTFPYLIAKITRKWGGVVRYDFDSLYSGSEEDYLHTAAMPADGSLVRLRVTSATGALYFQRVTSPSPESDFSAWSALGITNVIAVASCAGDAAVHQFYINSAKAIYHRESADNGATWSAWTNRGTAPTANILGADAARKPSGDIALFWVELTAVYYLKRTSGVWGVVTAWDLNAISWKKPTAFSDPDGKWADETKAYDNNTATFAKATCAGGAWSSWLELSRDGLVCSKVRFFAAKWCMPECAIEAYYSSAWHEIFNGSEFNDYAWTEINLFSMPYVTKVRFKGLAHIAAPDMVNLCEFDFGNGVWDTGELSGISVVYDGDYHIVLTGKTPEEKPAIYSVILGDGGLYPAATWTPPVLIHYRESTEPYEYSAPCVRKPDTTRLYVLESFTEPETEQRVFYSQQPPSATFDLNAWLEPTPTAAEAAYGLTLNVAGSYAWLTSASQVFRASTSEDELDITNKILNVDLRQYPYRYAGKLTLSVDNTNGNYNNFDRLGDEITIGLGYKTPAGNEYSLTSSFWITKHKLESPSWTLLRSLFPRGVIGYLTIETQDAWDFLRRYKTRRALEWASGDQSVIDILTYLIARAGLSLEVISASDAALNFRPNFTIRAGTTYLTGVKNLLKLIPDQLIFREAKVYLRDPGTTATQIQEILRPNGPGDETSLPACFPLGTAHWEDVDEVGPDEDRAYVKGDALDYKRDLYALTNLTHEGTVEKVTIYGRVRTIVEGYQYRAYLSIRTHGTTYDGEEQLLENTSYAYISWELPTNPFTGAAWTRDEVNDLQAGIKLISEVAESPPLCTQVFVPVTLNVDPATPPDPDWTYSNLIGTALLLFRGKYGQSAYDPTRAEVWGDSVLAVDGNYEMIKKVRDRLSRVTTPSYPDYATALGRAQAELRRGELFTGEESWLQAPTNCGIEPTDIIKLTDQAAGVANIRRRVLGIKTWWNKNTMQYYQTFELGAD
jgi:hypothetical protein